MTERLRTPGGTLLDAWVCEQIQRGLAAGTTEELVFGELESAVRGFHAELGRALGRQPIGRWLRTAATAGCRTAGP